MSSTHHAYQYGVKGVTQFPGEKVGSPIRARLRLPLELSHCSRNDFLAIPLKYDVILPYVTGTYI